MEITSRIHLGCHKAEVLRSLSHGQSEKQRKMQVQMERCLINSVVIYPKRRQKFNKEAELERYQQKDINRRVKNGSLVTETEVKKNHET